MEKSKYDELLANNKIVKFATKGTNYFRDLNSEIAIEFSFMHNGEPGNNSSRPIKRIFLRLFPLNNLIKEIPTIQIDKSVLVLANAEIYEYALTYKLEIYTDKKIVKVKLIDNPILGETFITGEEISCIEIHY